MGITLLGTKKSSLSKIRGKSHIFALRTRFPDPRWEILPGGVAGDIFCPIGEPRDEDSLLFQLARVSQLIANLSERRGGLLVHGALAAFGGNGVILAGASGSGKTTVSKRLSPPWVSLCDDVSLIVKKKAGEYWAHPWPTWSRVARGGNGGATVLQPIRLHAVFVLRKSPVDRVHRLGRSQALAELLEHSQQASAIMSMGLDRVAERPLRVMRFHNSLDLVYAISVFKLFHTLEGAFWEKMEKALAGVKP